MGLDYPGHHGAPDLLGVPHHEIYPTVHHYFQNNPEPPKLDYNLLYNLPPHLQSPEPAGSLHGSHTPAEANANILSSLFRGESLSNRESNFEQVKRVGLLAQAQAPGQSDLVDWASESYDKPLPFVYNQHGLDGDGSVANRRGMSVRGLSSPQSRSHGIYYKTHPIQVKSRAVPYVFVPTVARQVQFPRHPWPLLRRFRISHLVPVNPSQHSKQVSSQ